MAARHEISERGVELLLGCASLDELDRALLDATARCEELLAVELWRRHGATWLPVLARGPRELLPSDELVRAAAEGVIEGQLPGGVQVLANAGRLALVLAWRTPDTRDDRPLAWIALHAALAAGLPERSSPFPAPFPRRDP
ncbi:MAG: hypothetical protein ACKO4Q_08095 [Planctomycetota bacterium]